MSHPTQSLSTQAALAGLEAVRAVSSPKAWLKADDSLVTEADLRSHEAILARAGELEIGLAVHSEEDQLADWASRSRVLVIDPIDGTTNFSRGLPHWSISVALIDQGQLIEGAVVSGSGEVFSAALDRGAWLQRTPGTEPTRLRAESKPLERSILSLGVDRTNAESRERWWRWMCALRPPASHGIRLHVGAALDLCYVAAGRVHAYLHPTDFEWDFAAGALLCEEAGASLRGPDLGEFSVERRGIIAASAPLIEELQSALACPDA